jgi:clan AA aspartic protease
MAESKREHVKVQRRSAYVQSGVYQNVVVANPRDLDKQMRLRFLVDTGASGTVIPREVAEKLDLEIIGEGVVELADGSQMKTKLTFLYMKFGGEHLFTIASYNGCTTPLLGFDVMSVLGLQLDVARKRFLKPIRRFSLLSFILNKGWVGGSKRRHKRG